jgi:hypothetical protein
MSFQFGRGVIGGPRVCPLLKFLSSCPKLELLNFFNRY